MLSTVSYMIPVLPGGIVLATLVLLLVVPVFALAALAVVLLAALAILLALAAAIAATPVLVVHRVRGRWPTPRASAAAATRALHRRPTVRPSTACAGGRRPGSRRRSAPS